MSFVSARDFLVSDDKFPTCYMYTYMYVWYVWYVCACVSSTLYLGTACLLWEVKINLAWQSKLHIYIYILFLILEDDVDDGMTKALNVRTNIFIFCIHSLGPLTQMAAQIVLGCWIEIMGIIFKVYSRLISVLRMQWSDRFSKLLLLSVARHYPILDVTCRSRFFVPSLRPSYIGETVLNPCQFVGCKDFSELLSSSRPFDDSLFWFDFDSILFISYCARMISSQDFSYELIYMQYVGFSRCKRSTIFWIIQVRKALFLSGDIHEGIYI
jgi:hypothetical protein